MSRSLDTVGGLSSLTASTFTTTKSRLLQLLFLYGKRVELKILKLLLHCTNILLCDLNISTHLYDSLIAPSSR